MTQIDLSAFLHWCFNLVPPLSTQNKPSGPICVAKRVFLAYFGPSLVPVGPHLGHSGSSKWQKLVCLDVFIDVPTSFCPFQPKIGQLGRFGWPKGHVSPIMTSFWPPLAPSGSGKWPKQINLDVLIGAPTSFQPIPLNRGPLWP